MSVEHTEYWKEVCAADFEAKLQDIFDKENSDPPYVRVARGKIIISQGTGTYIDFKIDLNNGSPRFYLHNYEFWA